MVQAAPAPPLVVVQAQFLLELLVRLLAAPARLDSGSELLEAGIGGMAGEVKLDAGGEFGAPLSGCLECGEA